MIYIQIHKIIKSSGETQSCNNYEDIIITVNTIACHNNSEMNSYNGEVSPSYIYICHNDVNNNL